MRFHRLLPIAFVCALSFSCENDAGLDLTTGSGQAGSTARFAVSDTFLYLLDGHQVRVFSFVSGEFKQVGQTSTSTSTETIFADGDFLYLGATDGMYIYSIADRAAPSFVFQYQHILACDPVVVEGNRAYITRRAGTSCNNTGRNVLEIIDISDPHQPVQVDDYTMTSPYGLGIDGAVIFVCEGENGVKVYDVTNEHTLRLMHEMRDCPATDVIMKDGVATATGDNGIFQFSYGGPADEVTLLGHIPVSSD